MSNPTNTPEPLVSNRDLGSNMDIYEASLEKHTSHDVQTRLNMTTAFGAGSRIVRDTYEEDRANLLAQIEAMRLAGDAMHKSLGRNIDFIRVNWKEQAFAARDQWVDALFPAQVTSTP